jgi:hypothetical protein
MANKTAVANTPDRTGKKRIDEDGATDPVEDSWDDGSSSEYDENWLNLTARDRERSRIRRQMKARRELERRRDEKRLQQMVADWPFED